MIDIEELTIKQVRELQSLTGENNTSHPWKVGKNYFIRTVTHYATGKLEAVHPQELVLSKACWIADTGRLGDQWDKAPEDMFSEVEPFGSGQLIVGRGAVIDARAIDNIPSSQK